MLILSKDNNVFKIFARAFSFFFILLLITSLPAICREYYVRPSGNDLGNGTLNDPFATIQKAANVVVAGDTVCVGDGVYKEMITLLHDGTDEAWIVFKNIPGEYPVVDGERVHRYGFNYSNRTCIEINGFEIRNSSDMGCGNRYVGKIIVRNCILHGHGSAGIAVNYPKDGAQVIAEDNICFENGWGVGWASGIHINNKRNGNETHHIIRRNICFNNYDGSSHHTDGNGIAFDMGGIGGYCLIESNLCFNNGASGIIVLFGRADIVHNTCFRNGWDTQGQTHAEIKILDRDNPEAADCRIFNNIVWANSDSRGAPFSTSIDIDRLENNLVWSDKGENDPVMFYHREKNFVAKPEFVKTVIDNEIKSVHGGKFLDMNVDDYDFHLQNSSPGIGMAIDTDLSVIDIEKKNRNSGSCPLGAYETVVPVTSVQSKHTNVHSPFMMYPNPFNEKLNIEVPVTRAGRVRVDIYNISGQIVHRLVDEHLPEGMHYCTWDATHQMSGSYFVRFTLPGLEYTQKCLCLK
ncbi:T9SS type A sorting domain-containing protein [candidate division KSB1 bacterium]|nr:T9SS type A sorting domain-containing protein [candidate division KSB1 bacterium]